jgi:hypothetical protein
MNRNRSAGIVIKDGKVLLILASIKVMSIGYFQVVGLKKEKLPNRQLFGK